MIPPPRWTEEQLHRDVRSAIEIFRRERLQEPLQAYLDAFEQYQGFVEELLKASVDLTELDERASEVLSDRRLLEAFRFLTGPPLSEDDLKTLSEAVLSPSRLRTDRAMAGRIVEVVRVALDRAAVPLGLGTTRSD